VDVAPPIRSGRPSWPDGDTAVTMIDGDGDPDHHAMANERSRMCFSGHALMENRNGLLVDFKIAEANGTAERVVALAMLEDHVAVERATVAGDKGYDRRPFVEPCRELGITPHVASKAKHSAVDARTTRHPGYRVSQRIRKRVEEIFGWAKSFGGFRRTRFHGIRRTQQAAYFVGAAYNLLRIANLMMATT
jgi:IS5 family transposase